MAAAEADISAESPIEPSAGPTAESASEAPAGPQSESPSKPPSTEAAAELPAVPPVEPSAESAPTPPAETSGEPAQPSADFAERPTESPVIPAEPSAESASTQNLAEKPDDLDAAFETCVAGDPAAAQVAADASAEPSELQAAEGPKGDLSSRLRERGLGLVEPELRESGAAHVALSVSQSEEKKLFTPLADQGAEAVEEQRQAREVSAEDLLQSIKTTLWKWVQQCLIVEDTDESKKKRQKLLDAGILKVKLQARWSEVLHEKLKELIASYGGKLSADNEKDAAPAWAKAAEIRNTKWMVGFDIAAFEAFMQAHPDAVDPPEEEVQGAVLDFCRKHDMTQTSIRTLLEFLQGKFGKLRRPLLNRAKRMAGDAITQINEEEEKARSKKGGGKKKPEPLAKRARKTLKATIKTTEDIVWAEATLAPLGLRPDGEPVVKSPAAIAAPILEGLKDFQAMDGFKETLKTTGIGKVVNGFRKHSDPNVAKASKDLLACWRAAVAANNAAIKKKAAA